MSAMMTVPVQGLSLSLSPQHGAAGQAALGGRGVGSLPRPIRRPGPPLAARIGFLRFASGWFPIILKGQVPCWIEEQFHEECQPFN